ncbi:8200_t:CDS:2 [Funneliformis mosseae]|uniref:8200_t:CDS:1 n=1 Tax=Funneliformis mosseae TaxID=27381 RepID=A0A9N8VCQ0_FUNMO|nr:8200_t:CDS:2 [Funneliformis mosseae]
MNTLFYRRISQTFHPNPKYEFATESRKLKKSIKKRYHEVSSESDSTIDDYDEAITPIHSPSSTSLNLPLDFADNSGNFVRTMRIIKRESKRLSTLMIINDENNSEITSYLDDSSNNENLNSTIDHTSQPSSIASKNSSEYTTEDFYSEYFSEKKAKDRAIHIACRIKKQLPSIFSGCQLFLSKECPETIPEISPLDITKMIADRLYTFIYINELMPSFSRERSKILEKLDLKLSRQGDAKLSQKIGGHEAFFSFRFTLDYYFKHNILPSQKTLMFSSVDEWNELGQR